jgi:Rps23 Pro-64 3,4-dihydroxylase Tpa1-like proline 4-hydroxylase
MIHILFGAAASGCIKIALREIGLDKKEKVISFWDIFSIGPVWRLHEEIGVRSRVEWIEKCMNDEFGEYQDYTGSFNKTLDQIHSIPEGEHVTLWASDSAHEQTGLRFVVYLLKERNIDMTVINTTEEYDRPFRVKKVKYTLLHSGEITPEKLQSIYQHGSGKFLTDHDREELESEWLSLAKTRETLRIWRNGRIQSVSEDYYDEFIIKRAKKLHGKRREKEFMKSARLIGEVLGHLDQYIGDTFIEYRIKKLIDAGVFEYEGNLEAMRFYSVMLRDR